MNKFEVINYLKALKKRIDNYHTKITNEIDPKDIKSILQTEKNTAEQIQKIYDVISLINSFSEEELTEQNNNVEPNGTCKLCGMPKDMQDEDHFLEGKHKE